MGLLLGFDRQGIPPRIADELDQLIAAIQTDAGKSDGVGKWIEVPYDAADFSTDSGTWTVEAGDQRTFRYMVIGDTMWITFNFSETTVASTPTELRVKIPGDYKAVSQDWLGFVGAFGTVEQAAVIVTLVSPRHDRLSIQRLPAAAWANSTDAQALRGSIGFQVTR